EPFDVDPQHPAMRRQKILSEGRNHLHHENELFKWSKDPEAQFKKFEAKLADPDSTASVRRETKSEMRDLENYLSHKIERGKIRFKLTKLMESNETDAIEMFIRKTYPKGHSLDGVGVPGLLDAIFEGKVASNVTAGTEFIGDKEFYMYVDDLIRFYLNEEPLV